MARRIVIFVLVFVVLVSVSSSQSPTVGHPASQVTAGSFAVGTYVFPGASTVGIGTTSPSRTFEVYTEDDGGSGGEVMGVKYKYSTYSPHTAGLGIDWASTYWGAAVFQDGVKRFVLESNGGALIGNSFVDLAAPPNGLAVEGNVGIGTTSPGEKLHVDASSGNAGIRLEADDWSTLYINADTGNAGNADPTIRFEVNGVEKWRVGVDNDNGGKFRIVQGAFGDDGITIDGSNNVGIGTSTPETVLNVKGAISVPSDNLLRSDQPSNYNEIMLYESSDGKMVFNTAYGGPNGGYGFDISGSEKVTIDGNGNVDVGVLSGSGNAYVCADANGRLFRSNSPCV